jgi:hypothetical protein
MHDFDTPEGRCLAMRTMVWSIDLRAVEKLILLYAIHYSDPYYGEPPEDGFPFVPVMVAELADCVGATVPEIKKALSVLEARGFLKVILPASHRNSWKGLDLVPEFDAISRAFYDREA